MRRFFSETNPLFAVFGKLVDIVYVSLLWLLFSLPLVTIGASSTALYYTVTKVLRHERGYVWHEYVSAFKSNFKQSTLFWLIYLLIMTMLWMDIVIMGGDVSSIAPLAVLGRGLVLMQYLCILFMAIATVILIYALTYTARFSLDTKHILSNSALLAIRHLPWSLLCLGILVGSIALVGLLGLFLIISPGMAAMLHSIVLERIYERYMSEEDRKLEDLRNHPEQYEYFNRNE